MHVLTTFYKQVSENYQYIFFAYSTILYNCSKRSGIYTFIPASFNGIINCLHVKIFFFNNQQFLFPVDDVKTNNLELYFRKVFRYNTLAGHLILLRIFPVGQNVQYVFRLVGQFSNLVGHCPMSDRYFNVGATFEATGYYQKINQSKTKIVKAGCCSENNTLSLFLQNFLWSLLSITQGSQLCNAGPTVLPQH